MVSMFSIMHGCSDLRITFSRLPRVRALAEAGAKKPAVSRGRGNDFHPSSIGLERLTGGRCLFAVKTFNTFKSRLDKH